MNPGGLEPKRHLSAHYIGKFLERNETCFKNKTIKAKRQEFAHAITRKVKKPTYRGF